MATSSMKVRFNTRWPMRQTGDFTFDVEIPLGQGEAPLNRDFIAAHQLTDDEIEAAEVAALRAIAIKA